MVRIKFQEKKISFKGPRKKFRLRWTLITASLLLSAAAGIGVGAFEKTYGNRIYPGVYIGSYHAGNKTIQTAKRDLQKMVDDFSRRGLIFTSADKRVVIDPAMISPDDPDLFYALFTVDVEKTIAQAFAVGRKGMARARASAFWQIMQGDMRLPLVFDLNRAALADVLRQNFSDQATAPQNADIKVVFKNGVPVVSIIPDKPGAIFMYDRAIEAAKNRVASLNTTPIELERVDVHAEIREENARALIPEAENLIAAAPIDITFKNKNWRVGPEMVGRWLRVRGVGGAKLALDDASAKNFFDSIAPAVETAPTNAVFAMKDGRVTEFKESRDGLAVARAATLAGVLEALRQNGVSAPLVLQTARPELPTEKTNQFGISERIGSASTSFAGSPKNRKYNIAKAVEKLNGILISPNKEFTLIEAIGDITADAGFKEELVIKGDRTIPEFGGGLCQIATTVFRVALNSGLPILERRNHSYRVSYYEPPVGMDATIYLPKPDLRFKNDTGQFILLLARVEEKDMLVFEFWGKLDGRKVTTTAPVVTNLQEPPPPKIIETEDLPPGKKKCTEKAHVGADAKFTYTITYPDGRVSDTEFRSHYRPWQEVCLVGKEKVILF